MLLLNFIAHFCSLVYIYVSLKKQNIKFPYQILIATFALLLSGIRFRFGWLIFDLFFILIIILLMSLPRKNLQDLFISKSNITRNITLGILMGLFFGYINKNELTQISEIDILVLSTLAMISSSAGEEIIFRGFILGYLRKSGMNLILANFVQSFLFIIAHPNYFATSDWLTISIVWAFGFISGYVTLRQENIIPSVVMHIVANSFLFFCSQTNYCLNFL